MDRLRHILAALSFAWSAGAVEIIHLEVEAAPDGSGEATCHVDSEEGIAKVRLTISGPDGTQVAKVETPAEFSVNWMKPDTRKTEIEFSVRQPTLWTDETPQLYTAHLELLSAKGGVLATRSGRFAFCRVEVRPDDGIFMNGQKMRLRGINLPFQSWPTNGEARLELCRAVVRDTRWLNANAIWCTNAVPEELPELCDEAGLFVVGPGASSVPGHHPSVLAWSRADGVNQTASPSYGTIRSWARSRQIVLAVPLLPQQGEGGLAAGLDECWTQICAASRCAGGVLQADDGWTAETLGAQGTAIREIWAPVVCTYADRTLTFSSRRLVLGLDTFSYTWQALSYPARGETVLAEGTAQCPTARPGGSAQARLPPLPTGAMALRITIIDRTGAAVCTWSFHLRNPVSVKWPQGASTPPPGLEEVYFLVGARTNRAHNARRRMMQSPEFYAFSPPDSGVDVTWGRMADGSYRMDYKLACKGYVEMIGMVFPPLKGAKSTRWLGRGPDRMWYNRRKGQQFGLWSAETCKGGFHSDAEWFEIDAENGTYRFELVSGMYTFSDIAPHGEDIEGLCRLPPFGPGLFYLIPGIGGKNFASNETGPSGCTRWMNLTGHRTVSGTVIVRWTPNDKTHVSK